MLITVTCPVCQKRSQIDDKYTGKKLRCPYPECRAAFRLSEDGEALPVASHEPQEIPPVRARGGEPQPEVADWQAAPPPRQGYEEEAVEAPAEVAWEAPPVQRGDEDAVYAEAADEENGSTGGYEYDYHAPVKKHTVRNLFLVGIVLLLIGGGVAAYFIIVTKENVVARLSREADREYGQGNFSGAKVKYDGLLKQAAGNQEAPKWRLRSKFCEIRNIAPNNREDIEKEHRLLGDFQKDFFGKREYRDVYKDEQQAHWEVITTLTEAAAVEAEKSINKGLVGIASADLELAKKVGDNLRDLDKVEKKHGALERRIAQAAKAVEIAEDTKTLVDKLHKLAQETRPGIVEEALQEFKAHAKVHPPIADNEEVKGLIAEFKKNEPNLIKYMVVNQPAPPKEKPTPGIGFLPCPQLAGAQSPAPADDRVLLALAPGIVYGLAERTGEARWAMRVGLDTHTAPIRLAAVGDQPELALILSAELNTLSAVDTRTGLIKWTQRFESSCAAWPIMVGRRAFLPAKDGKVYEIEIGNGTLHGFYDTGLELTVPGAFDPTSGRLFIPASHSRIYVLNTANAQEKACAGVIYTDHTVGGLRGAPIVTPETAETPAILVVAEAVGLDAMRLRSFTVPDNVAETKEMDAAGRIILPNGKSMAANNQQVDPAYFQLAGWSWFPPYYDGDNLGTVTDQGVLGLFGLKRGLGMRDKPLFQLVLTDKTADRPIGPAQIAHVDLQQWWLVINGRLERYRFDLYRRRANHIPGDSLTVGSPLQPGQPILRGRAMALVTQGQERALATAIDTSTARISWQRQLGIVAAQDPMKVGDHLLIMDKKGGLLEIEPNHLNGPADARWRTGGNWLANGIDAATQAQLLLGPEGKFAVAVIYNPTTDRVTVRKFEPGNPLTERVYPLESMPQGTMAANSEAVVVPCRDGSLRELPLGGAARLPAAFAWRDPELGPQSIGHAGFVADNHLVVSDGGRKIQQWRRAAMNQPWQKLDDVLEVPGRIATPLLMMTTDKGEKFIVVGDENGTLVQFSAANLASVRQWSLRGKFTKGPYVVGNHIGCIVDHRRFFWLDGLSERVPDVVAPLFTSRNEEMIIGEPRIVGNLLVVAEMGGYTWIDPVKGTPRARDAVGSIAEDDRTVKTIQRVRTLVTPATGATPLGPGQAIAPVSDGTFLILTPPAGDSAG